MDSTKLGFVASVWGVLKSFISPKCKSVENSIIHRKSDTLELALHVVVKSNIWSAADNLMLLHVSFGNVLQHLCSDMECKTYVSRGRPTHSCSYRKMVSFLLLDLTARELSVLSRWLKIMYQWAKWTHPGWEATLCLMTSIWWLFNLFQYWVIINLKGFCVLILSITWPLTTTDKLMFQ